MSYPYQSTQPAPFYAHLKPPSELRHIPPIEDVLAYANDKVLRRFLSLYDMPWQEASEIFREVKRFMWACSKCEHSLAPNKMIDAMWHNFILFTPDYVNFCFQYFGYFVHHIPADKEFQRRKDPQAYHKRVKKDFERQLGWVAQHLGDDVLRLWYVVYPTRYDAEFFTTQTILPKPKAPQLEAGIRAL